MTTTFGNVSVAQAAENALYLLAIAGHESIPVTRGVAAPLGKAGEDPPAHIHGADGLGNLAQRETVLLALQDLPQAMLASDAEVLSFVEKKGLFGRGIGYVDAHLLAAVFLTPGSRLWTRDNSLFAASTHLGVAANLWH